MERGREMLHRGPENPADEPPGEAPHQHSSQPPAGMKVRVEKNQGEAEKAQPQVRAHPGLHPAYSPDRYFLPRTQEAGDQHEEKTDDPADHPKSPPSTHSLRSSHRVG